MPKGIYKRTLKARKNMSKSKLGEKNPNFGNKKLKNPKNENPKSRNVKMKERVFGRDRYTCQRCRKKFNPCDLILYYLTAKGKPTNKIDNIMILCRECEIIAYKGSIWGKTKKGKDIINRWGKEDIKNMKICRMQTQKVYPYDKSPNKNWYPVVYDGKKRVEVNPNYKERSSEEIMKSVVNFSREELKNAIIRVLKERGQNPEDWNFENCFRTDRVNCDQRWPYSVGSVEVFNRMSFLNQSYREKKGVKEKEKLITMASK